MAAPPQTKISAPQTAQHAPQTPLSLRHFQDDGFFIGDQQRTRRKLDRVGAMTFFFEINHPKNFGPSPQKHFAPLEQRSSYGTVDISFYRIKTASIRENVFVFINKRNNQI